jgi:putative phosphoribosyl transferase
MMSAYTFADRLEGGRVLAEELLKYRGRHDVLVLALPRGGVPVGYEIAHCLHAPLEVFLVRKLGVPGYEELAMGALASGGTRILNEEVINHLNITSAQIEKVTRQEQQELERRERAFRDGRPAPSFAGKVCILVDDGLATGSTMRAAVQALRSAQQAPAKIIVAVPVASAETCEEFRNIADEVVCTYTPDPFFAVGRWYDDFTQLTDEDVREFLERASHEMVG